jgi:hypothetical protein
MVEAALSPSDERPGASGSWEHDVRPLPEPIPISMQQLDEKIDRLRTARR